MLYNLSKELRHNYVLRIKALYVIYKINLSLLFLIIKLYIYKIATGIFFLLALVRYKKL